MKQMRSFVALMLVLCLLCTTVMTPTAFAEEALFFSDEVSGQTLMDLLTATESIDDEDLAQDQITVFIEKKWNAPALGLLPQPPNASIDIVVEKVNAADPSARAVKEYGTYIAQPDSGPGFLWTQTYSDSKYIQNASGQFDIAYYRVLEKSGPSNFTPSRILVSNDTNTREPVTLPASGADGVLKEIFSAANNTVTIRLENDYVNSRQIQAGIQWTDAGFEDITRPNQVAVELVRTTPSNPPVEAVVGEWTFDRGTAPLPPTATHTFENMLIYESNADGALKYAYSLRLKDQIPGYTATPISNASGMDEAINLTLQTKSIEVAKSWDFLNAEGITDQPQSVTVNVSSTNIPGGKNIIKPLTLSRTGATPWKATASGLPQYYYDEATGRLEEVAYQVEEVRVNGYTTGYAIGGQTYDFAGLPLLYGPGLPDALGVKNTLDPVSFQVTRAWDTASEHPDVNTRPASVTVYLYRTLNGVVDPNFALTQTISGADIDLDEKTLTFLGLPYCNLSGATYNYYASEESPAGAYAVHSYESRPGVVRYDAGTRTYTQRIVSSLEGMTDNVTFTKSWQLDNGDAYDTRPESLTFRLKSGVRANLSDAADVMTRDGVPFDVTREGPNWFFDFGDLPTRNNAGETLYYSIKEIGDNLNMYTSRASGRQVTNTLKTTSLNVRAVWVGDVSSRPAEVTLGLSRRVSGEDVDYEPLPDVSIQLTATGNWANAFVNLPQYAPDGITEYEYSVYAIDPPDAYTPAVPASAEGGSITVTYTHNRISFEAVKVWVGDERTASETRPANVTISLLRDGAPVEGEQVTLQKSPSVMSQPFSFKDLPRFDKETGAPYTYTIGETAVGGYTTLYETDRAIGGQTYDFIVMNTAKFKQLKVEKDWQKGDLLTSKSVTENTLKPANITLQLWRYIVIDGEPQPAQMYSEAQYSVVLPSQTNTFVNLPWGDDQGREYTYYAVEVGDGDYAGAYEIINDTTLNSANPAEPQKLISRIPTTELSIHKNWLDKEVRPRPANPNDPTLTFRVFVRPEGSTGAPTLATEVQMTPGDAGVKPVTGLPVFLLLPDGTRVKAVYAVEEVPIGGHLTSYVEPGEGESTWTFTNQETDDMIRVQLYWDVAEGYDRKNIKPVEIRYLIRYPASAGERI